MSPNEKAQAQPQNNKKRMKTKLIIGLLALAAVGSSAIVRRFVASVLKRIYGVRGSLKPPLGGPHAGRLYSVRYHAWKLTNRLYHWSGLPTQWHAWYDANR